MRWRTRIILSVLFGTAATVAVAWSCALWSPVHHPGTWSALHGPPPQMPMLMPAEWTADGTHAYEAAFLDYMEETGFGLAIKILRHQTSVGVYDDSDRTLTSRYLLEVQSGWPFRALRCDLRTDYMGLAVVNSHSVAYAPAWARPARTFWVAGAPVPVGPVPLGIAVDAAFYSALFVPMSFIPRAIIRTIRRRKGRCPACNYDRRGLRENAPCPECGQTPSPAKTSDKPAAG